MDNQLRLLERAASYGDPGAVARLIAHKLRSGIPDYGAVPKQIWDYYHLQEEIDDRYRRNMLKLACKLAKTKPGSELRIASQSHTDKGLAIALATDIRFPTIIVSSSFGLLGMDMNEEIVDYPNIFKGFSVIKDYDAKNPLENKIYQCNVNRCRARHFEKIEPPARTNLIVCEPLTMAASGRQLIITKFTVDSETRGRSAAASWQKAIKTLAEKVVANYGRVWYIRALQ